MDTFSAFLEASGALAERVVETSGAQVKMYRALLKIAAGLVEALMTWWIYLVRCVIL